MIPLSRVASTACRLAILTDVSIENLDGIAEYGRNRTISPCDFSNRAVLWIRVRYHIHPTRQFDAYDTCCCGEDGLDDASHLRADTSVRKCVIEKDLTFRIECRTVVYEGYYGVPNLSKHHGDTPAESTNVVSALSRWSESSLGVWQVTVQYPHQLASNDSRCLYEWHQRQMAR